MFDEAYFQELRRRYPTVMSKEQLYKVCHISKRVSKYYLDNDIIPCQNSGHVTHKYTIKTEDVIEFLRRREASPAAYKVTLPSGAKYEPKVAPRIIYTDHVMKCYEQLIRSLAATYPDLMTVHMISELTGYSEATVHKWTPIGNIRWLRDGMQYYAPKELVIRHLLSEPFRNISGKCKKHRWILQQLSNMIDKEENSNE